MEFSRDRFRELRVAGRWSLSALARAVNISRRTLSRWENGKASPSLNYMTKLSAFFNVPVTAITDSGTPQTKADVDSIFSESSLKLLKPDQKQFEELENIKKNTQVLEKKLLQTSIILQALLSSIHIGIYINGTDNSYLNANKAMMHFLNIDEPDFSTNKITDYTLFPANEAKQNAEEDLRVLASGKEIRDRQDHIPGTRRKRLGLISKYPIINDEKTIVGVIGCIVDITERHSAEERRRILEYALSNIDYSIWISRITGKANKDYRMEFVNDTFTRNFGLTLDEMNNDPLFWRKTIDPKYQIMRDISYSKKEYPASYSYEMTVNGRTHHIDEKVFDCKNNFFMGIISDRKAGKPDKTPGPDKIGTEIPLLIFDEGFKNYLMVNKAAVLLYGFPEKTFYRNGIKHWIDNIVAPESRDRIRKVFASRQLPPLLKYEILSAAGNRKSIESYFIPNYRLNGTRCIAQVDSEI